MLDELSRVGAIEQMASGAFKVLVRMYTPKNFHPDALQRFGEVVRDFVNTYEYNMDRPSGTGRFERIMWADDGLREELMPAFNTLLRAKGYKFLVELHNWIGAQENTGTVGTAGPVRKGKRRIKTGVGVYHFVSED